MNFLSLSLSLSLSVLIVIVMYMLRERERKRERERERERWLSTCLLQLMETSVPVGLPSVGQTCYASCMLQVCIHTAQEYTTYVILINNSSSAVSVSTLHNISIKITNISIASSSETRRGWLIWTDASSEIGISPNFQPRRVSLILQHCQQALIFSH